MTWARCMSRSARRRSWLEDLPSSPRLDCRSLAPGVMTGLSGSVVAAKRSVFSDCGRLSKETPVCMIPCDRFTLFGPAEIRIRLASDDRAIAGDDWLRCADG